MLSSKGPTEALLGGQKKSAVVWESNDQIISDRLQEPTSQSIPKSELQPETLSKGPQKKGKKSKAKKNFTFILKIFNIVVGLLLTAFGGYCYYGINHREVKNFQLIGYIMPGYLALSGLLIVAIEMHIGFICRNMKFLYNYFGRGCFNIYVGIMPLTLLDQTQNSSQHQLEQVTIYIVVSLLLFIGALYILAKICCCAKEGDKLKKSKKRKSSSTDSSSSGG